MTRVVARRLTALTAVTALVSGAGLATGALVGVASAAAATSVSPSAVSNASATATTLTINGSGFTPIAAANTVKVVPHDLVGKPVEMKAIPATVTTASASQLIVTVPLTNVAPVPYDVVITNSATMAAVATCPSCLTVTNPARPSVTGVAVNGGGGYIAISGANIAIGAKVSFFSVSPTNVLTLDDKIVFVAGRDTTNGHTSGYASTTTLNGQTSKLAGAVAGKHILKVTNQDGQGSTQFVEFWQPIITTTSPAALGQGASNIPVTVSGAGIRTGSTLAISQYVSGSTTTPDVTVGTSTVAPTFDSITAPVSVTKAGGSQARTSSVTGPDGGYDSKSGLTVTLLPNPNGGISVTGFGQGAQAVPATISGTDFAPLVEFSAGNGVTITRVGMANATDANVTVTVDPNAVVGDRAAVTATNPDHGTSTYEDTTPIIGGPFLTVNAGPVITSIDAGAPNHGGLGANQSKAVTLAGTGFDTAGMTLTSTGGLSFTNVVVNSATSATATATSVNAAVGPRDVTAKNTADKGQYTCVGCLGIDSLSIGAGSAAGANTNNAFDVSFTAAAGALTGGTFVLHKSGPVIQPDITGTSPVISADGSAATVTFDLSLAAPGLYNATVTKAGGGSVSCTGCFTVSGTPFTIDATAPITPANGGQGAVDFPVTLHGTNFVRGERISIAGVTVSETTYVSPTTMTATVSIPQNAATGAKDVVVTSSDGIAGTNSPAVGKYTIVAAPTLTKPTSADNLKIGQGASNQAVAVEGTGLTAGTVAISGAGITVTTSVTDDTHATATVTVAGDAATGPRDLTVVSGANGGRSLVQAGALTITAKPVVSLVSPARLDVGKSAVLTISGQGFQKSSSVPVIGGQVTFSGTDVSDDGTTMTTTATVASTAPGGARAVTVQNNDGGTGTCACAFTVVIPTALTNVLATSTISGTLVANTGRLTNAVTGAGIGNVSVIRTLTPAVGPTSSAAIVTDSNGNWSAALRPTYNTTSAVSYAGDSGTAVAAATAPTRSIGVATKVTLTSPSTKARTSAASIMYVTGATSPNKAGKSVYLFKRLSDGRLQAVVKGTVASNGTYKLGSKLAKGAYTLVVQVPAVTGNTTGRTAYFQHFRV